MNQALAAPPWVFFGLVFLLSAPFYILGIAGGRLPLPVELPASALMAFVPMLAAIMLVWRAQGPRGVRGLLMRSADAARMPRARWIAAALLFMPAVCLIEYFVLRLAGASLPAPVIQPLESIAMLAMFFMSAAGEELGWQGYAYPALRRERTALGAAVIIGVVWALWHVIPYAQMGRSAEWIMWHCLGTVMMRIVIVWIAANAGESVFIAIVFHTMINLSWALFPEHGSHYDPFVAFFILAVVTLPIVALWGPSTLSRFAGGRFGGGRTS